METNFASVIALAKELISKHSITPFDAGCQNVIRARLSQVGFNCESLRFEEVDNLWARVGTQGPLLVFAAHTDVVPPGPEKEWTTPPFMPTIRDDYLFGRGAADMKAALAAMIVATEVYLHENPHFNGSIGFLITSDEEGPALHGTQKVVELLEQRGEKIDYCLIGEPSSENTLGDQIRIGRRGSLHGKLTVHGKQGHVAHPHLASNPIHLSAPALDELAKTIWDQGNDAFPPTTLQITNIHSGTGAANVIPGELEALFNLRFSTVLPVAQLKERVEAIFQKYKLDYHIEWKIGGEPFLTPLGRLVNITQAVIKETLGLDVKLSTGGGTSDGRFIAKTGAEIVELGLSHATAHQVDECANINDIVKLAHVYNQILKQLF